MAIALSSTVRVMGPISNGTLVELPIIVAEALVKWERAGRQARQGALRHRAGGMGLKSAG